MTQAMAQIGRTLLTEFVKMCEERNANSIQYYNQRQQGSFGNILSFQDKKSAQGQGGPDSSYPQKFNEGSSQDWLQQDQLFEIC